MLCWFLLYKEVNQLYVYIYIPSLMDLPPTLPPSHPSRSLQSTELSFLCYIIHQLPTSICRTRVFM